MNDLGIYIHIPFCLRKCFYCDFVSYEGKAQMVEKYINALCKEIINNADILSEHRIRTIYIGGGTPSFVEGKYIKQVLDTLMLFIDKETLEEVTIEVNPNSASLDKLKTYKEAGVNRLSIGLQSTYDSVLKTIGRAHNMEDFENTLSYAQEAGIDNISVDLIYPLPGIDLESFKKSVDYVCSLKTRNVKHVSIYNLEVHEGTKLAFLLNEGYVSLVDEDEEYEMYNYLKDTLVANGFERYEISNYALPGYESKHNSSYWNGTQYLGFGVNASGFFNGTRYSNEKSIEKYIEKIESFTNPKVESEDLDLLSLMKEHIILGLRQIQGINVNTFKTKFKKDIYSLFSVEINDMITKGLLEKYTANNNEYIKLTQRGLEIANVVWEAFI